MKALVLEKKLDLSLREFEIENQCDFDNVKIKINTVGICGSDIHYYEYGKIGNFVVREPMILGHEGSGTVIEIGKNVRNLKVGDRVCVEPGIPNKNSKAYKMGMYNLDKDVKFWATPPVHGCLRPEVIMPSDFTFKLPNEVSFAEGAMIEPLAVGLQAVGKANIKPGFIGLVLGCGPIGIVTALSAIVGGCSKVFVADVLDKKLQICEKYNGLIPIDITKNNLNEIISDETNGWGVDVLFEASGATQAYDEIIHNICLGGTVVIIGMPVEKVSIDMSSFSIKEIKIETVFRYANQYEHALSLLSLKKIDVKPLISDTLPFKMSVEAFIRAAEHRPNDIKIQINEIN